MVSSSVLVGEADDVEEFSSELEKFASHLVLENQSLQHENKQLGGLLKEYENTLENVMSKFRGVAVSLPLRCSEQISDIIACITTARPITAFILHHSAPITSNCPFI